MCFRGLQSERWFFFQMAKENSACKLISICSKTQLSTCIRNLFFEQGDWEWSAAAYSMAVTLKHSLKTWHLNDICALRLRQSSSDMRLLAWFIIAPCAGTVCMAQFIIFGSWQGKPQTLSVCSLGSCQDSRGDSSCISLLRISSYFHTQGIK